MDTQTDNHICWGTYSPNFNWIPNVNQCSKCGGFKRSNSIYINPINFDKKKDT